MANAFNGDLKSYIQKLVFEHLEHTKTQTGRGEFPDYSLREGVSTTTETKDEEVPTRSEDATDE